jgi:pyruvate, water dikinase
MRTEVRILQFSDPECRDAAIAGGKGAGLATMTAIGMRVPPGFVIAADALAQAVDTGKLRALAVAGDHEAARRLVLRAEPPRAAIAKAYERLGGKVAVRSSACAEDSKTASYAGQLETYLNVEGADEIARRVVDCWASFFAERALFYRDRKGSLDDVGMAVVVQQMVEPDKSGVLFTMDPVNRRRDRMIVEATFGPGERVVSGEVTPDHYVVDRRGILKRSRTVGDGPVLESDEFGDIVEMGTRLEEHFGGPQDIEWAMVGGTLYLLQCRPITTL